VEGAGFRNGWNDVADKWRFRAQSGLKFEQEVESRASPIRARDLRGYDMGGVSRSARPGGSFMRGRV